MYVQHADIDTIFHASGYIHETTSATRDVVRISLQNACIYDAAQKE